MVYGHRSPHPASRGICDKFKPYTWPPTIRSDEFDPGCFQGSLQHISIGSDEAPLVGLKVLDSAKANLAGCREFNLAHSQQATCRATLLRGYRHLSHIQLKHFLRNNA